MTQHKDYRHFLKLQIRFADIDRLNHVNNACYHNYVELGRVNYLNEVLGKKINWNVNGFILARTEIDHLEPIFLNDEIWCCTKIHRLGNKSAGTRSEILKIVNGEIIECAHIAGVLVAMDYSKNESILIPAEWRELIERYEN
jgi:acyl-CoA thioester hydrolase